MYDFLFIRVPLNEFYSGQSGRHNATLTAERTKAIRCANVAWVWECSVAVFLKVF